MLGAARQVACCRVSLRAFYCCPTFVENTHTMKRMGFGLLLLGGTWALVQGVLWLLRLWLHAPVVDCNKTYDTTML